jgi:hypothetical protein
MKSPVSLEFSQEFVFTNKLFLKDPTGVIQEDGDTSSFVTVDLPKLTTAYPKPGEPAGSERMICKTVGALVKLDLITHPPPVPPLIPVPPPLPPFRNYAWRCTATAALMGSYGGKVAIIQQHTLGPVVYGYEGTGEIFGPNPLSSGAAVSLYTVANMSAGGYGFDYLTSYSNLMDSIFLRLQVARFVGNGEYFQEPIKFRAKGVLLAGDPV